MIPDTEFMRHAIPVPEAVDKCPRCDNPHLGRMITLRLEYCPCCHAWLKYVVTGHGQARGGHTCK
jgi:hypothetical protein